MAESIKRRLQSVTESALINGCVLNEKEIMCLCTTVKHVLLAEPTLLRINKPVVIVGDIHGQYSDLLRWFTKLGWPSDRAYLFLGDYVDRGPNSIEVMCLLMCLKILYPSNIFLLRGNHESINMSMAYGLYDECTRRVSEKCWYAFTDMFDHLPIAAIVNNDTFCVHGGIGPELVNIDAIGKLERPMDANDNKLLIDMLWSDPTTYTKTFTRSERGLGVLFGQKAVNMFLARNNLKMVCRGHEVAQTGIDFKMRDVVTIFSAPNYCGDENDGAVMTLDNGVRNFEYIHADGVFIETDEYEYDEYDDCDEEAKTILLLNRSF